MTSANNDNVYRGLLFPVDGPAEPVSIRESNLIEDLYREMRCTMVEIVRLVNQVDLWCDEEAVLRPPRKPNRVWALRRHGFEVSRQTFGNVVALGRSDDGTKSRSLTVDEADDVFARIIGANHALDAASDPRPRHPALAAWLREGIDWRQ